MPEPEFLQKYHDLKAIIPDEGSYCDWEGFADPSEMTNHVKWIVEVAPEDTPVVAKDLTLHWVHENIDQGGYSPTELETKTVFWAYYMLFASADPIVRWWAPAAPAVNWETGTINTD